MQLASMGPATALCDCSAYIFLFLAVTTTNLVANARARGDVQGTVVLKTISDTTSVKTPLI